MTKQGFLTAKCSLLTQGEIPEWIEILPAPDTQGRIIGRDGRWWSLPNPQVVVDAFGRVPVFGDYEHASEVTVGEAVPATAWVEALEVRGGAVWGKVKWTEKASEMIKNKEYRFISPVFNYTIDNKEITEILSFGLTNQPNLELRALNTRLMGDKSPTPDCIQKGKKKMKAICKILGLAEEASEDAIVTAINTLKDDKQTALNKAETPPADKFVPKADYEVAINKVTTAEEELAELKADAFKDGVEVAVNKALEDGKISPATKAYHIASCKTADDLKAFTDTYENAPEIIKDANKQSRKVAGDGSVLTPDEKAMCKKMGVTEEDFTAEVNAKEA